MEFSAVVQRLEHRYEIKHEHIPFLGLASFYFRLRTKGGIKGLRLADFENIGPDVTAAEVNLIVRDNLGPSWHLFLKSHDRDASEDIFIYVRPDGGNFRFFLADVEREELSIIRIMISGKIMKHWSEHPEEARRTIAHHE